MESPGVVVALAAAVYFAPALVAYFRGTSNRMSVGVVNLFLGWTFVGWVVALAMALSSARPRGEFTRQAVERREAREARRGPRLPPPP